MKRTFSFVLECETHSCSLSTHFWYTLYKKK